MRKASAYLGVGIVAAVTLVGAVAGDRVAVAISGALGGLAAGLFAATAVFALVAYRDRRDVPLLLVGVGSATIVAHEVFLWILQIGVTRPAPSWNALVSFSTLTGMLVLLGNLLAVVPWRDRRGRPPLRPGVVVAASAAAAVLLDLLAVFSSPETGPAAAGGLRLVASIALVAGGVVAVVRCLQFGGRFAWVAAAALAIAILGAAALAANRSVSPGTLQVVARATVGTTGLAAASLLVFVVLSLRMESSRMRRASDRATQVMEGRAEIASIVAHDVRGPAGTIRSVASSLRTSYGRLGDAERLEFVGMIQQESQRLLRIADQMSLGLKTDAGTLPFTLTTRDLEGPVLQGIHDADVGAREVRVDVDGSIRAPIDERWIAEAVRQGLDNATKFSPPDAPIDVRVHATAGAAVIEVTDRGPGIPEELRERVFEKFCRWRPYGYEDKPGSGLGLFIVRSIAREHHGAATVGDGADGGTILQIRLPLEATT